MNNNKNKSENNLNEYKRLLEIKKILLCDYSNILKFINNKDKNKHVKK